jgi:hypothetical protein
MAIAKSQLLRWLNTLEGDPVIAVSDDGVTLMLNSDEDNDDGPYLEVGGFSTDWGVDGGGFEDGPIATDTEGGK